MSLELTHIFMHTNYTTSFYNQSHCSLKMCSLQLPNCRVFNDANFSSSSDKLQKCVVFSSFWGVELCFSDARLTASSAVKRRQYRPISAMSSSSDSPFNMNLNEYMVTLVKPLGIRFALSVDGKVFVHALKKGVSMFSQLKSLHLNSCDFTICNYPFLPSYLSPSLQVYTNCFVCVIVRTWILVDFRIFYWNLLLWSNLLVCASVICRGMLRNQE